jgi:hypothetical protein
MTQIRVAKVVFALVITISVSLFTSCVYVNGIIPPQEVKLRIKENTEQYVVVVDMEGNGQEVDVEDGMFQFETPPIRWGEGLLFGFIPVDRVDDSNKELIQIYLQGEVVKRLSYDELMDLPRDNVDVYELSLDL